MSTLDHDQARAALASIASAQTRSTSLYRYRQAAPYLWIWAAVWFFAYGLCDLLPGRSGLIWLVADGIGVAASILL
ncbi:MAG TPA: hypothetical protein VIT92_05560, partial [Burkholderiaceae bacterium]